MTQIASGPSQKCQLCRDLPERNDPFLLTLYWQKGPPIQRIKWPLEDHVSREDREMAHGSLLTDSDQVISSRSCTCRSDLHETIIFSWSSYSLAVGKRWSNLFAKANLCTLSHVSIFADIPRVPFPALLHFH